MRSILEQKSKVGKEVNMTFREKLMQEHPECVSENYGGGCIGCPKCYGYEEHCNPSCVVSEVTCTECWDREIPGTEPTEDPTNPSHYTDGGMECIDEMVLVFGKERVADFCLCNVWKYRYRATRKNGEEDIAKSHWYMAKYKELMEELNDTDR